MFNNISMVKDQILNLHQFMPVWGKCLVVIPILIEMLIAFYWIILTNYKS
jgi:hypothetical protein